jgi:hypothetical protein
MSTAYVTRGPQTFQGKRRPSTIYLKLLIRVDTLHLLLQIPRQDLRSVLSPQQRCFCWRGVVSSYVTKRLAAPTNTAASNGKGMNAVWRVDAARTFQHSSSRAIRNHVVPEVCILLLTMSVPSQKLQPWKVLLITAIKELEGGPKVLPNFKIQCKSINCW